MEWISINDKLPECRLQHGNIFVSPSVLVFTKYGGLEIDKYYKKDQCWSSNNTDTITHWMPLPDPPQSKIKAGLLSNPVAPDDEISI